MICLGLESTAHTIGFALITDKGKVLAENNKTFTTEQGGIIPTEAANHHKQHYKQLLNKTLKDAKLTFKDINLISFSQSPGLAPSLVVGKNIALDLSKKHKIKLVGVNHICAHLEIGKLLTKAKDPVFVFTSGANTQIIAHEEKYRIFGEALSTGLGNALDKFGRIINLGFPAGPKIEQLAKKGKFVELPYVIKGMDVEFSGVLTRATQLYQKGISKEDLCYSIQETGFAMLTEVTERAIAHCNKKEVLLIGGVAANKRLCKMLNDMCKARKAKFYPCPIKYCGDNATMIAWQGILEKDKKQTDFDIKPRLRIDEIETTWIKK